MVSIAFHELRSCPGIDPRWRSQWGSRCALRRNRTWRRPAGTCWPGRTHGRDAGSGRSGSKRSGETEAGERGDSADQIGMMARATPLTTMKPTACLSPERNHSPSSTILWTSASSSAVTSGRPTSRSCLRLRPAPTSESCPSARCHALAVRCRWRAHCGSHRDWHRCPVRRWPPGSGASRRGHPARRRPTAPTRRSACR